MERQSRQTHRTSKNKIKQEIENKKDAVKIDKQTQTPRTMKERKKKKDKINALNNQIEHLATQHKMRTIQITYHKPIHHCRTK